MSDHESINADYLRKAAQQLKHIKETTYQSMNLRAGDRVLDAGCGPGVDTIALAKRVGAQGSVFGVDADEMMLREADKAAQEAGAVNVQHLKADVLALPFEDGFFDACRAERLLQVLPRIYDPRAVTAELLRVVRSGGRIVLADTDWASASVAFPDSDLERRMMHFFARELRPNGFAGRQLFSLLQGLNVKELEVEIFPVLQRDPAQTPFGDWLTGEALKRGTVTQDEADFWKSELDRMGREDGFFSTVNMIVVGGTKA